MPDHSEHAEWGVNTPGGGSHFRRGHCVLDDVCKGGQYAKEVSVQGG